MTTVRSARIAALPSALLRTLVPMSEDVRMLTPNSNARPADIRGIACVVLHATADDGNEPGAEAWMCDARSQVSAHLHVRRDGTVVRLVSDARRAWHAGPSLWRGITNVNDISLGWEMANRNDGREPYTDAQYESVARLAAGYVRQGIPLDAFVSHAEVAIPAGRKRDPAGFDWGRFRALVGEALGSVVQQDSTTMMGGR